MTVMKTWKESEWIWVSNLTATARPAIHGEQLMNKMPALIFSGVYQEK